MRAWVAWGARAIKLGWVGSHQPPATPPKQTTGFAVVVISYDLAVKFTTSKRIIPGQFKVGPCAHVY